MRGIIEQDQPGSSPRPTLERGERTVHHQEAVVVGRIELQGMTEDRPERPAVGGNQNRLPTLYGRIEGAARTSGQRQEIFTSRGAFGQPTSVPVIPIFCKSDGDLRPGQPLPQAVVAFTEVRRRYDRKLPRLPCRNSLRRLPRPAQIARIDHIQRDCRQTAGQRLSLKPSPIIEGNIGMSLDPLVLIPVRLAVACQIND
jgi:hypothetical protein